MKKKNKPELFSKIVYNLNLQLIVCAILSFLAIISLITINNYINKTKFYEYIVEDDIRLLNSIENLIIQENSIKLVGYAFLLERDSDDSSISIVLNNIDTTEDIWLETIQDNRPDVNSYFYCEYNYLNSGFIASTYSDNLDKDAIYEILINIDYIESNEKIYKRKVRKTVSSGRFIQNNELYTYNPREFEKPNMEVESDVLKNVFLKGNLCFYDKEIGLYLYEFNGSLYWITTKDFEFEEDGNTHIINYVYTTQVRKLKDHRVEYKFDIKDFIFEEYEYLDEITSPYRAAIYEIPKDYAIAYISTGVYNSETEKWVWGKSFHIDNLIN